jgi:hypothetical protein
MKEGTSYFCTNKGERILFLKKLKKLLYTFLARKIEGPRIGLTSYRKSIELKHQDP